jgi:hypothetical protein
MSREDKLVVNALGKKTNERGRERKKVPNRRSSAADL